MVLMSLSFQAGGLRVLGGHTAFLLLHNISFTGLSGHAPIHLWCSFTYSWLLWVRPDSPGSAHVTQSWFFDPILLHSLAACSPCLVIFYSCSIGIIIRRFKRRCVVKMDSLKLKKNNWDMSGMVFMLTVRRGLKLMWPICSCCMTFFTSHTSYIFYNFPSLNPSLKSRLPNIPNMIWQLFLLQCPASLTLSYRNWKEYFNFFSYLVFVLFCFLESWGEYFQCFLDMLSKKEA